MNEADYIARIRYWITQRERDPERTYTSAELLDACDLLRDYDALAARLASADIEATSLLMAMVQQWPDVHPDWKPLPDVAGKITQINNMVAGLRARLAEAEHLILRMAGEDYQRARFYVEKYDLTGERAAVSADGREDVAL